MIGSNPLIPICVPDTERLAVFKECLLTYGMDDRAPVSEWPHNLIAKSAIAYSCGRFALPGRALKHDHDPGEFALCRRLAAEAAELMKYAGGLGGSVDQYRAYFCVVQGAEPVPSSITTGVIRDAFGGTIYPPASINIEPMSESTRWWRWAEENRSGEDDLLAPHRKMLRWFRDSTELRSPAFVYIGDDPLDEEGVNLGGVFARLAVALTEAGSLVGVCGLTAG